MKAKDEQRRLWIKTSAKIVIILVSIVQVVYGLFLLGVYGYQGYKDGFLTILSQFHFILLVISLILIHILSSIVEVLREEYLTMKLYCYTAILVNPMVAGSLLLYRSYTKEWSSLLYILIPGIPLGIIGTVCSAILLMYAPPKATETTDSRKGRKTSASKLKLDKATKQEGPKPV